LDKMRLFNSLLLLFVIVALTEGVSFSGTWSAVNRYGGEMYLCTVGRNQVYGVFSKAGFIKGYINGNKVNGTWYEGGSDRRAVHQGSFQWTLSDDGLTFDGFYNREAFPHGVHRWTEHRLAGDFPQSPTHADCMVPVDEAIVGTYQGGIDGIYSNEENDPRTNNLCADRFQNVYGSFNGPRGWLEGWEFDNLTGFQGFRYTNDNHAGAYVLRATEPGVLRGFAWYGSVHRENIGTVRSVTLQRVNSFAKLSQCEAIGPGFGPFKGGSYITPMVSIASTLQLSILLFALCSIIGLYIV